jgi:hypothetical protein
MAENNNTGKILAILGITAGVGVGLYFLLKPSSASAKTNTGLTPSQQAPINAARLKAQQGGGGQNSVEDAIKKELAKIALDKAKDALKGGSSGGGSGGGSGSGGGGKDKGSKYDYSKSDYADGYCNYYPETCGESYSPYGGEYDPYGDYALGYDIAKDVYDTYFPYGDPYGYYAEQYYDYSGGGDYYYY